ncbi:hypothetical protein IPA_03510 [Ignicoccus pacificus DSM 13166]|uniref:Uncharacterized protein n=1 Tax=Ignicoccus pacificus DSM 13166 TaxID=940294 RepID=A0A977PKS3_9CREN|nr:hypothetical protein IPA_03510 [Ignicoccus pacificus DSM 13166]
MSLENLNERQKRALENVLRALKANDYESAKVIIESEFDGETREEVIKYLEDLGYHISFHLKKPVKSAAPKNLVIVRERPKTFKPISFAPVRMPLTPPIYRERPLTKEYDLALIPLAGAVYSLIKEAKYEVLIMSHKLHPKISKELRKLSNQGLEVKALLSEGSCESIRLLGGRSKRCLIKETVKGLGLRSIPLGLALYLNSPFNSLAAAIGGVAGLSLLGLWGLALSALVLSSPAYLYAGLPWGLKGASITSLLTLGLSLRVKKSNVELRTLERVPYSIVVVDGKKAIVAHAPFSWKGDVLSRVYRSSAEEALREFRTFWEVASAL